MASKSSKEDTVTSKPHAATSTHIDGKVIKKTIKEIRDFLKSDHAEVYVILGVNTTTDPDIRLADMVVLGYDSSQFVYSPQPPFNNLICSAPLPEGYVLYVGQAGELKTYWYQVPNSSPEITSPYLEPTSVAGDMVPCKEPRGSDDEHFVWKQDGDNDNDYQIYKDENNTKMYWQFGVQGKVIFSQGDGFHVSLEFKVPGPTSKKGLTSVLLAGYSIVVSYYC